MRGTAAVLLAGSAAATATAATAAASGTATGAGVSMSGPQLTWYLVAAALLIVTNGTFVAFEFAILSAHRSTFESHRMAHRRTSRAALASMSDLSTQLAGAQLGVTMASLGLGFVGEPAVEHLVDTLIGGVLPEGARHAVGVVAALALVAFLHLVLGEMVPKSLALAAPDAVLRMLVLPYRAFLGLFRPVIRALNTLAFAGCRLLGVEPRRELVAVHSASELAAIVNTSSEEGVIEADDAQLLSGALAFALRPVGQIATPLAQLSTVRFGATAAQVERVVAASGQERVPIRGVEPQRPVIGYVHARDLLSIPARERLAPLTGELIRSMAIVRAERSLIEVLRTLRRVQRQMAVVTGDDGALVGVVSMEDVVRALMAPTGDEPTPASADVA